MSLLIDMEQQAHQALFDYGARDHDKELNFSVATGLRVLADPWYFGTCAEYRGCFDPSPNVGT